MNGPKRGNTNKKIPGKEFLMKIKAVKNKKNGMICIVLAAAFLLCGCRAQYAEYQMSELAMGTLITGIIYAPNDGSAENVVSELSDAVEQLEKRKLSWKEDSSETARINKEGSGEISEELKGYLEQIMQLCEDSDGAVDPTMGKVIDLWNFDEGAGQIPDASTLAKALEHVDYRNIIMEGNNITIPDHTALNLGAFGKGIGSDVMVRLLENNKQVGGAILSLGNSSIMTYGSKPDGKSWKVAVNDPSGKTGSYLGVLSLTGTHFVSTSGDYEKYFEKDGIRYHHILDPQTGYPARSGLASVTVIGDNGLLCDGLSTACFILGIEKGKELLKEYGAEGIFVKEGGEIVFTEQAERWFTRNSSA